MNAPSLIVVTGSTGFTGTYVVRELARRFPAARLRCFVRASSDRRVLEGHSVEFVEGDAEHPTETTELWTFTRRHGGDWQLSAIQAVDA